MQEELALGPVGASPARSSAPGGARRRTAAFAAAVVLVVAVAAFAGWRAGWFDRGLVGDGALRERDPVLVAHFADGGSGLGAVVADALRTDLSQSPLVTVVQPTTVRDALLRMERDVAAPMDSTLAYELA
ncbi:hypothetical protein RZS08_20485, partial [Arthrospira platensis SPKY1]|nr:hypothetical protein [Arthrospira platensis SPKY1]